MSGAINEDHLKDFVEHYYSNIGKEGAIDTIDATAILRLLGSYYSVIYSFTRYILLKAIKILKKWWAKYGFK
jgi:hypothetical protein